MRFDLKKNTGNAYVPAEWQAQACIWTAWPDNDDLWPPSLLINVQQEVAGLINALSENTKVKVLINNDRAMHNAKAFLNDSVDLVFSSYSDIWLRDTGPIFIEYDYACRFNHNGWGAKYLYPHDIGVAARIIELSESASNAFDVVLEGGALEHNGSGAILTTRQCLLHENRNNWTQQEAESLLFRALNAHKIYWLDQGLHADHTDGHIDNIARFIDEETVLCASANGHNDPNQALYFTTQQALREQGLKVETIPSPGLVLDDKGGIMPASYLNYIISNNKIIVPSYGCENIATVLDKLRSYFIGFDVITLPAKALLSGGGSFHCITQQQVAKKVAGL